MIPEFVLIINKEYSKTITALTLYTNRICLREDSIWDHKLYKFPQVLAAKSVVNIWRELAHFKRIFSFSEDLYSKRTSMKFCDYDLNLEAGYYVEKELFGGRLDLSTFDVKAGELILDAKNYASGENHANLKKNLVRYYLKSSSKSAPIGMTEGTEVNRCAMKMLLHSMNT